MTEMKLIVLLLSVALHCASSEFFHEQSVTLLKPKDLHPTSQFGFSMGYQGSATNPQLVVGAPLHDYVGKVFSCPLSDLNKGVDCDLIDMTSLNIEKDTDNVRKYQPGLNYYYGASVVATPDYFLVRTLVADQLFACGPMLHKNISEAPIISIKQNQIRVLPVVTQVTGACYLHRQDGYHEWLDQRQLLYDEGQRLKPLIEKKRKCFKCVNVTTKLNSDSIKGGGLGWNALVDSESNTILVPKPSYPYGMLYGHADEPLQKSQTLKEYSAFEDYFDDFLNIGYGMAAGHFFSESETVFAVSTESSVLFGRIIFLKWYTTDGKAPTMDLLYDSNNYPIYIDNELLISSMFGYSLAAADLSRDGLSDLIVGAPALTDREKEVGAVIIYTGGEGMADSNVMIIGDEDGGRFGYAIATSNIDSDSIPEIFVSTIYGKVFVLSGYELNKRLFQNSNNQIHLSELELTQVLKGDNGGMGLSLQVVKDINNNGCDELAIGSPSNSEVKLYRCLPAVNASVTLSSKSEIIQTNATSFEVEVCLEVRIGYGCRSIEGSIIADTIVTGRGISEQKYKYTYTIKPINETQNECDKITVKITPRESARYSVTTKLSMSEARDEKKYKPWAVLSPWSKTKDDITVLQYCNDTNCQSSLEYDMVWQGDLKDEIDTSLESRVDETVVITVNNTGQTVYSKTALDITVKGAESSMSNGRCSKNQNNMNYICTFDSIQNNTTDRFKVLLDMKRPFNVPSVTVTAELRDEEIANRYKPIPSITKKYKFDLSKVSLTGLSHDFKITDKDMADASIDKFTDNHEYIISNYGTVTWKNLVVTLEINKEPFIQKYDIPIVYSSKCSKDSTADEFVYECPLTLEPNNSVTIAASIFIFKEDLENLITKGNRTIRSTLSFILSPTGVKRNVAITTHLHYSKILSVGNNQTLIIVLVVCVALVLLLIISLVLYKIGFFKRDKKKLTELRASVRNRSVIMPSEANNSARPSAAGEDHCDIEVVEDPFDEIAVTPETDPQPKDDVELIKEPPSKKEE